VRVRSTEWRRYVANDPRLVALSVRPEEPENGVNRLRATVLVKR